MIKDNINNLKIYKSVIPQAEVIINYLKENDIFNYTEGRYEILDEKAFLMINDYITELFDSKKWEAHRRYADIQIVLSGREYIGVVPVSELSEDTAYDEEKDILFLKDNDNFTGKLLLEKGEFLYLLPQEAHKPGLHFNNPGPVKKCVIKVLLD